MQTRRFSRLLRAALVLAAASTALSSAGATAPATPKPETPAASARIQTVSGAYLAAKSAQMDGDLAKATDYYAQALTLDPNSEMLQQDAMFAFFAAGRFDDGVKLAAKLRENTDAAKVARITLGIDQLRKGKWGEAIEAFDIVDPSDLDALLLTHLSSWADLGAGRVDDALSRIKELDKAAWYPIFNQYQSGLVAEVAGRHDEARRFLNEVLKTKDNAQTSPDAFLGSADLLARIEARAGKKQAAIAALDKGLAVAPSYDPLLTLKGRIEKGETIELPVTDVKQGAAETLYVLGQAINRGDGQQVALLYFQLARALAPASPALLTALAGIAERANQLDLAISYYEKVPESSSYHRTSELQMGIDLWYAERKDEAKAHLRRVVADFPDDQQAYVALADILSADKDYRGAATALDKAISLVKDGETPSWNLYYQRGIAHERLKEWDKAEPDFKKALALSPNQPQVLNYLGYSWVDMNRNLDQGLEMIKTAVELRPNDGYIIDSLGWAYYRLSRYPEAVEQLERAILINPVDPTINDHLGDAYWQVGRKREARFQWQRALTGDPKPEAADVTRIQAKIDGKDKPAGGNAASKAETSEPATPPPATDTKAEADEKGSATGSSSTVPAGSAATPN
ncbi:tetratricopeptide repeat protein [Mangrovicella endophytica]|uniref:tetratricopeptide repeat protein n=1 Tax=Mangrovicella endophytica TaxID=2066697 RepID=UPI000C9E8EEA|nr:tetratricopeptide repeat protein [Mangrovicella endophytica]